MAHFDWKFLFNHMDCEFFNWKIVFRMCVAKKWKKKSKLRCFAWMPMPIRHSICFSIDWRTFTQFFLYWSSSFAAHKTVYRLESTVFCCHYWPVRSLQNKEKMRISVSFQIIFWSIWDDSEQQYFNRVYTKN